MKKSFLLFAALAAFSSTFAQSKEDISANDQRAAKLQELIDSYPKASGDDKIDSYGKSVYDAAISAVANNTLLSNVYYRQIGETKDGVADVNVKKPTVDECVTLAGTITKEASDVKNVAEKAEDAVNAVKDLTESAAKEKSPMKAAKAAKTAKAATSILEFCSKATPILVEESASHVKVIEEIVKTAKSAGNL